MRQLVIIISLLINICWLPLIVHSQQPEQQLEDLSEKTDNEIEDDDYSGQLQELKKHPLNINIAQLEELQQFPFLSAIQIQNFLSYRKLFGNFLSIYELQAIPGWDINTIRKIIPYLIMAESTPLKLRLQKRIKEGEQYLLLRSSQILEQSKGYEGAEKKYMGSPQKLFLRYQFHYKNLLRWGLTAEKDAGEQFFKGREKTGFDFYSFHLYATNLGKISSLAIGDFTINLGQGLIQWQSLAFKKNSEVIGIERQSQIIHPYNSAGEFYFSRGTAITIKQRNIYLTAFASLRKLDANTTFDSITQKKVVTSFLSSGYHRTQNELDDKNAVQQLSYGGNLSFRKYNGQCGLNFVGYYFSLPVQKREDAYNLFAISGRGWSNFSFDYSFNFHSIHFFGEAATDKNLNQALLLGLIASPDPKIDISVLCRMIGEKYQTLYGNAFTENNLPSNENGLYTGLRIRPWYGWQLDFYADLYKFPWLKYQTDAPSFGKDFLLQLIYQPKKDLEIYARFKTETKDANSSENLTTHSLSAIAKQNFRLNINYQLNKTITIRSRLEMLWYNAQSDIPENGFLGNVDCIWKPAKKSYSSNFRLQYFETTSYATRLYAYENDVAYSYSIPAFYDKGWRYYWNASYERRKFATSFRWSQLIYPGKKTIGSGNDEINGNRRTEIKLQLIWYFKNE